jgi:hypothetical protein
LSLIGFTVSSGTDWAELIPSLPDSVVVNVKKALDPWSIQSGPEGDDGAKEKALAEAKYRQTVTKVQEAAKAVPEGATVLVISEYDEDLVRLPGRKGWHFPQTKDGKWADKPADTAGAIACLEMLRAKGARYLLIPKTYEWWLDDKEGYPRFKKYLDEHGKRVHEDEWCIIYRLTGPGPQP